MPSEKPQGAAAGWLAARDELHRLERRLLSATKAEGGGAAEPHKLVHEIARLRRKMEELYPVALEEVKQMRASTKQIGPADHEP